MISHRQRSGPAHCAGARLFRAGIALGSLSVVVCAFAGAAAPPQLPTPNPAHARSYSGQFVVQSVPPPGESHSRQASTFETNRAYITLDPTLLPVSCERIKRALLRQLGGNANWDGRIYLALHAAQSGEDPIGINATKFRDGWQYQLELPDLLDRVVYVRSVVDVLLLEMANRGARERSAEIPAWLSEGLSQELLFSSELEIILPPPRPRSAGEISYTSTVVQGLKEDPLVHAHRILSATQPLTFQQLSWPVPEQLEGQAGEVYRSSAQLFVNRLSRFPDGPACLRAMLDNLPNYYNWQFAFLRAFNTHFQRPLDIEKWWALEVAHFTGRELAQTWSPEESWQKFEEVIHPAVRMRSAADALPVQTEVKLQAIITQWDPASQTPALQAKVRQLEQLRLRLAPGLTPLADQYHAALATYLEDRTHALLPFFRKRAQRNAAKEAVRELDRLDATLATMRPLDAQAQAR